MRTLALLFLGVVVGWAASGVDWSREAVGEGKVVIGSAPLSDDHLVPDSSLSNRNTALIADPVPGISPEPTGPRGNADWNQQHDGIWPRPVWETRMQFDANGQQHPVKVSRLVNADGSIAPETPALVGRFQASAYGSPNGHGCFVVDTMTGKTWHVANAQQPQVVTEALSQKPTRNDWLIPDHQTPAGFNVAPPGLPQKSNVVPTPANSQPDDAN